MARQPAKRTLALAAMMAAGVRYSDLRHEFASDMSTNPSLAMPKALNHSAQGWPALGPTLGSQTLAGIP